MINKKITKLTIRDILKSTTLLFIGQMSIKIINHYLKFKKPCNYKHIITI